MGRTAVVAGGAGGIGRPVAERERFRSGWAAVAEVVARDSSIDVLVNSAGYLGSYAPFEALSPHEWQRIISVTSLASCRLAATWCRT